MEQSNSLGMCTFDQSLSKLFADGLISEETALSNADKESDLKIILQQIKLSLKKNSKQDAFQSMDTSVISLKE
jgi:twitching motility protein PilU